MSRTRSMGAYQPRTRRATIADIVEDFRRRVARFVATVLFRGSGLLLLIGAFAGLVALATYNPADGSLNNATGGEALNWLQGPGATAADLLLQLIGLAAYVALGIPAVWGAMALSGRGLAHASWRAVAWPVGVFLLAAGLGGLPSPLTLPAGAGGLMGLAVFGLVRHAAGWQGSHWLQYAIPLLLLGLGTPAWFFATGLRLQPLLQGATAVVLGAWSAARFVGRIIPRARSADEEEDKDDDEEAGGPEDLSLDVAPEPVAETSGDLRGSRVRREQPRKTPPRPKSSAQPALDLGEGEYQLPPLGLLAEPVRTQDRTAQSDEALEENARMLEAVLADFGVRGRIVAVRPGPVVTLYEFEPAAGVKSSRVISLSDDVARSMSAVAARIAVIPGRNVLGIELPNHTRETVFLRDLIASGEYERARAPLVLALGKTIGGEPVMADLAKMPHLLIAGTTGSGKSVALNTMILSLLYRLAPDQARMILIDPKMLELSVYDAIPHLLAPVVTDPRKAVVALKWAVREMEERYRKMSKLGVRGVEAFNERVHKAKEKGEALKRTVQTGFDRETGKPIYEDETLDLEPMPYIVVVVDEMADLMMISGKEIEGAVQRLAQMARAAGIHLIAATQRPSVDVITGTIKANFPTRISFQVTSKVDSRTILGEQGAEQLLGQGDMLYMMAGGRISRVHGPFVTDREVEDVVRFLKTQGTPDYLDAVTEEQDEDSDDPYGLFGDSGGSSSGDELYDKALAIVARERRATTSYIQRRLVIGYNRAARLIERMEEEGVISKPNHQGKREVLLPDHGEE
ncbi:MAG TPA: DNA translocase FtsK 4TM domain-containing protein [Rhizomicrobium sp.]|nr:DNA translocase FtsK 4TM domain-containing protein [Rhizomicrobium sp.]